MRAGACSFELLKPGFDCGFTEAAIAPELDVGDAPLAGLGPDPAGSHAKSVGDLFGGEQAIHDDQRPGGLTWRPQGWDECLGVITLPCREGTGSYHAKNVDYGNYLLLRVLSKLPSMKVSAISRFTALCRAGS